MDKYRLKIEKVTGNKFKHIFNIMFDTSCVEFEIALIKTALEVPILTRKDSLNRYLQGLVDPYKDKIGLDALDSKGDDITGKEFIENEIFLEII